MAKRKAKKKKKKPFVVHVRDRVRENLQWSLEGNIDEAIKVLIGLKEQHGDKYSKLEIDFDYSQDYGDCDRYTQVTLIGLRPENDKEREERIKKEREVKEKREQWEKQQLANLKKKYEGDQAR